jgi:hypothetical protein
MKRGRSFLVALAVLAFVPLPLLAQGGGMGGQGRGGMGGGAFAARTLLEHGSVEFLVTKAADLQLSAEQSAKLTAIGEAWAASTKEPRTQLSAAMPQPGQAMGGGDPAAMRQRLQDIAPVAQKLVEDDEKAVVEAMKLLDEAQQAKAKQLLEERAAAARPRR